MEDLVDQIAQLDPLLIDQALTALVQRCNELFAVTNCFRITN